MFGHQQPLLSKKNRLLFGRRDKRVWLVDL